MTVNYDVDMQETIFNEIAIELKTEIDRLNRGAWTYADRTDNMSYAEALVMAAEGAEMEVYDDEPAAPYLNIVSVAAIAVEWLMWARQNKAVGNWPPKNRIMQ